MKTIISTIFFAFFTSTFISAIAKSILSGLDIYKHFATQSSTVTAIFYGTLTTTLGLGGCFLLWNGAIWVVNKTFLWRVAPASFLDSLDSKIN